MYKHSGGRSNKIIAVLYMHDKLNFMPVQEFQNTKKKEYYYGWTVVLMPIGHWEWTINEMCNENEERQKKVRTTNKQ